MERRKALSKTIKILLLVPLLVLAVTAAGPRPHAEALKDGEYAVELTLTGGSGKASVVSPTVLYVKDGQFSAQLQWSSSNYDYMIVDGKKYLNESSGGYSTFTIPISAFDKALSVVADTTAMGAPHEVPYTLTFYADSIGAKSGLPQEATKRVLYMALGLIVVGGILNHFVQKKRNCDYTGNRSRG